MTAPKSGPKIWIHDIERLPGTCIFWDRRQHGGYLSKDYILSEPRTVSWAGRWYGQKKVEFFSEYHDGREAMLDALWDRLDEADAVVGFNSDRFDNPLVLADLFADGYEPPSPFQEIDLMKLVKRKFKFLSHRLGDLAEVLQLDDQKMDAGGIELWLACMAGDEKAWNKMRRYNKQDIETTTKLLERLEPWVKLPTLHDDDRRPECKRLTCSDPYLGMTRRGTRRTAAGTEYPVFQCRACGGYQSGSTREAAGPKTRLI